MTTAQKLEKLNRKMKKKFLCEELNCLCYKKGMAKTLFDMCIQNRHQRYVSTPHEAMAVTLAYIQGLGMTFSRFCELLGIGEYEPEAETAKILKMYIEKYYEIKNIF